MSVLITIIIPSYNRPNELKRAINSVLIQTVQDFEIIVVDDCSEVDLSQIINSFNDNRILYYKLEKKGNANVCRNYGINNAKGVYIAMLDSDDEWLSTHLEKKQEHLIANNADGVFGSYILDNGKVQKEVISRSFNENELMVNYLLSGGKAATPTHFYKTDCVKTIMWDEELFRHQDYDFSVRFSRKYKFIPSTDLTCIVHWQTGEKRTEHFPSQLKFIDKHKHEISPKNYNAYHKDFFLNIKNRIDVSSSIKKHYKVEQVKYIHVLSLNEYLELLNENNSFIYKIYLRLIYVLRVLIKK